MPLAHLHRMTERMLVGVHRWSRPEMSERNLRHPRSEAAAGVILLAHAGIMSAHAFLGLKFGLCSSAFSNRFCRSAFRRLVDFDFVPCGVETFTDPSGFFVSVTGI